jgi:hypothetical protein
MRRKLQSSTEEKYLSALQEALRGLLLFTPQNPQAIFVRRLSSRLPPSPPSWPRKLPYRDRSRSTSHHLLDGHPRLILTGAQGTGVPPPWPCWSGKSPR